MAAPYGPPGMATQTTSTYDSSSISPNLSSLLVKRQNDNPPPGAVTGGN